MDIKEIKISVQDMDLMPVYQTEGASGADLKSAETGILEPNCYKLIKTGVFLELPKGYEAQVRARSGLALKHGIGIVNAPGTIDSDYRGEIGVILINHGKETFNYKKGDRIAQLVIAPYTKADFKVVTSLSNTERGVGGFGHTGK